MAKQAALTMSLDEFATVYTMLDQFDAAEMADMGFTEQAIKNADDLFERLSVDVLHKFGPFGADELVDSQLEYMSSL
jgi:hypothetical protein